MFKLATLIAIILIAIYSSAAILSVNNKENTIDMELSDNISLHDQSLNQNNIPNLSNEVASYIDKKTAIVENHQLQLPTMQESIQEMIGFMFSLLFFFIVSLLIFTTIILVGKFLINLYYKKQIKKNIVEAIRLANIGELYPHISDKNAISLKSYIDYLDESDSYDMKEKKQKLTHLIFQVKQDYGINV